MGFRTIVVSKRAKLSYKNGYMIIREEKDTLVFIKEIDNLMIETTECVITGVLICELLNNKTNIVFCNEKHNPFGAVALLDGSHNSTKKIINQTKWCDGLKREAFTKIIKNKIINQSNLLFKKGFYRESENLKQYANDVLLGDVTNREGFAAKVYFNALFGLDFHRDGCDAINSALDYGYTILLSCFNREVVTSGFLTELGLHHCNEFNKFNLSCDLIEPFRVIIDDYVFDNLPKSVLDVEYKHNLVSLLSRKIIMDKEYFLNDAISLFVKRTMDAICNENIEAIPTYEF